MQPYRKFIPIEKAEEQSDGTLYVYGVVTAEEVDRDGEICDYESTAPFYKSTADQMLKATSVPGMEHSIMPLREMHQLNAVGCGKTIDFDPDKKQIRMGFQVVAAEACKKVRKGVLPGFSQGGRYVKTWEKDGVTHYTADPGEVSLVDRGSLPSALIEYMKAAEFQLVKADGSIELRKFVTDAAEDPSAPHLVRISELEKQVTELLAAAKSAKQESNDMTPEELQKRADDLEKKHAAILDNLKAMHKSASDHYAEMSDHVDKCMKSLGHDGIKADDPAMKKAADEKAAREAAAKADTVSKADAQELAKAAAKEALDTFKAELAEKADPANRVRLKLVGRDGNEVSKAAEVDEEAVGF